MPDTPLHAILLPMLRPLRTAAFALPIAALVAACSTDDTVAPPAPVRGEYTVDASAGWAYYSFADSAVKTYASPAAAQAAGDWDIAFNAQAVMLNGGEAGPGGVSGFCVCQNSSATPAPTNAQLYAQDTSATQRAAQLAEFDAVTGVPAGAVFATDVFVPVVRNWFTGTGAAAVANPAATWVVRNADGTSLTKVHVTAITGATATSAGRVTLQFAVAPSSAGAWGADQTLEVDLGTGEKLVDFNTGAIVTSGNDWDVRLSGFAIRTNGGVSGTGAGRAAPVPSGSSYATIQPSTNPPQAFTADAFTGVFGAHPWSIYNLVGNMQVTPTYDVYLVRRGNRTYKVQLTGYYNATRQPRRITFRYATL